MDAIAYMNSNWMASELYDHMRDDESKKQPLSTKQPSVDGIEIFGDHLVPGKNARQTRAMLFYDSFRLINLIDASRFWFSLYFQ